MKKLISIVTPCFNEEENVEECFRQVRQVFLQMPQYDYEHIFIDNASKDKTVPILRRIAMDHPQVKVIVNTRNFGWIKSPYHGICQSNGDATILFVCDLQDPPSMISEFLAKWEEGYKVVIGVKNQSEESPLMFRIRKVYYNLIDKLSETQMIKNYTGFGLYDKRVIEILREIDDPYPYFRGLIIDIGFDMYKINYTQPARRYGITTANFYRLYDVAMLGITNHSKVPLRLATMLGLATSILSFIIAGIYFVYKLIFWSSFSLGIAPLVIGIFFFGAIQLFFIGIVGEYIGSIHTQVLKRPLVIEKERINF